MYPHDVPLLTAQIRRDPVPAGRRRNSHLFVVARPHGRFTATGEEVNAAVVGTGHRVPLSHEAYPGWRHLTRREDRDGGTIGFSAPGLIRRRMAPYAEERELLDVEVTSAGTVALFCGRASDLHTPTRADVLIDGGIVTLTRSVLTLAGLLGAGTGTWLAAVAVTDIALLPSISTLHTLGPLPNTEDPYIRTIETTADELRDHPERPTVQLLDPLLRRLGVSHSERLRPHSAPTPPP